MTVKRGFRGIRNKVRTRGKYLPFLLLGSLNVVSAPLVVKENVSLHEL